MTKLKIFFVFLTVCLVLTCTTGITFAQNERGKGFALQKGDCIGVLAPSACLNGFTESAEFKSAVDFLKSRGYRVKLAPSCDSIDRGYFAGTAEQRAADINNFFADDEVKAILCTRGGYGTALVLDKLDYEMISRHPKPLIGYSDIIALHNVLVEKAGIISVHAPMLFNFMKNQKMPSYTKAQFFTGIASSEPIGEILLPNKTTLKTLIEGETEGIIVGGNLAVLTSLVGTPYELDGTGALLLIEDVGERPYRIDRMLNQLYQSGLLNRVNGILFGDFTDCKNGKPGKLSYGNLELEEVLEHYAKLAGKPTIIGVPAGHEKNNMFLPFGVHATLKATADGKAKLIIDEAAFKS